MLRSFIGEADAFHREIPSIHTRKTPDRSPGPPSNRNVQFPCRISDTNVSSPRGQRVGHPSTLATCSTIPPALQLHILVSELRTGLASVSLCGPTLIQCHAEPRALHCRVVKHRHGTVDASCRLPRTRRHAAPTCASTNDSFVEYGISFVEDSQIIGSAAPALPSPAKLLAAGTLSLRDDRQSLGRPSSNTGTLHLLPKSPTRLIQKAHRVDEVQQNLPHIAPVLQLQIME